MAEITISEYTKFKLLVDDSINKERNIRNIKTDYINKFLNYKQLYASFSYKNTLSTRYMYLKKKSEYLSNLHTIILNETIQLQYQWNRISLYKIIKDNDIQIKPKKCVTICIDLNKIIYI
jgi:hypothetical protein